MHHIIWASPKIRSRAISIDHQQDMSVVMLPHIDKRPAACLICFAGLLAQLSPKYRLWCMHSKFTHSISSFVHRPFRFRLNMTTSGRLRWWIIFFLPTSINVLPTFQTFCPVGVNFANLQYYFILIYHIILLYLLLYYSISLQYSKLYNVVYNISCRCL